MSKPVGQLGWFGLVVAITSWHLAGCGNDSPDANATPGAGGVTTSSTTTEGSSSADSGGSSMTSSSGGSTSTGGNGSLTGSTAARNTAVATPELLLSGFYPTGIAVDTNNLYWTTLMGELSSMPLTGGDTIKLNTWSSNLAMRPLIAAQSGLYLLVRNELNRCLAGTCQMMATGVRDYKLDAVNIYWLSTNGELHRMPLTGGSDELLFELPSPWTFGLRNEVVYYEYDGTLYSHAAAADATTVGAIGDHVSALELDDSNIYAVLNNAKLVRMGYDGGGTEEILSYRDISQLRVLGGYLYFLAKDIAGCGNSKLNRYSPMTGKLETLLADWMCIQDYAVTGDSVYFAYYGWNKVSESALYRMPLK